MRRAPLTTDYATWKSQVAAELERLHHLQVSHVHVGAVPDSVWTRLYVRGLPPEEAARAHEVFSYNTRPPGILLKRQSDVSRWRRLFRRTSK
jgi:hypothetical protein